MTTFVTASIVLHDSAADIEACLHALTAQTRAPDAIVIRTDGNEFATTVDLVVSAISERAALRQVAVRRTATSP